MTQKKLHVSRNITEPQPTLITNSRTGESSRSLSDRAKYPRLYGADLYVARLGWNSGSGQTSSCCSTPTNLDDNPSTPERPTTGSLHDELSDRSKSLKPKECPSTVEAKRQPSIHASRPCYRCICYMSSVGIKRVFWTTDTGAWEGAKVRDLVDAMDNLATGDGSDTGKSLSNVFVTKHEVLMLRRIMGHS
jgi:hypothetical protein